MEIADVVETAAIILIMNMIEKLTNAGVKMKIEKGIRPNCSEWDEAVEPDYYEESEEDKEEQMVILGEIKKANKISDWND